MSVYRYINNSDSDLNIKGINIPSCGQEIYSEPVEALDAALSDTFICLFNGQLVVPETTEASKEESATKVVVPTKSEVTYVPVAASDDKESEKV